MVYGRNRYGRKYPTCYKVPVTADLALDLRHTISLDVSVRYGPISRQHRRWRDDRRSILSCREAFKAPMQSSQGPDKRGESDQWF